MTDQLTKTEQNALKWVQFDEKMTILHGAWERGEVDLTHTWRAVVYYWRLFSR